MRHLLKEYTSTSLAPLMHLQLVYQEQLHLSSHSFTPVPSANFIKGFESSAAMRMSIFCSFRSSYNLIFMALLPLFVSQFDRTSRSISPPFLESSTREPNRYTIASFSKSFSLMWESFCCFSLSLLPLQNDSMSCCNCLSGIRFLLKILIILYVSAHNNFRGGSGYHINFISNARGLRNLM